jgi:exodeoxyribonuclease VII small subunit
MLPSQWSQEFAVEIHPDGLPMPQSTSQTASFEASLAALEAAVHDLEDGQLGLAEALARYEQSVKHLKHCYQLLESAEQKIELLTGVGEDGAASTEPFVEASEPLADTVGRRRKQRSRPPGSAKGSNRDIDG